MSEKLNPKLVDIKKLNVIYSNGGIQNQAIFDVDLEVKPRQFVAIVGESGSGKTTIAKTLLGHQEFMAETLKIGGVELPRHPLLFSKSLRKQYSEIIQMIYQSPLSSLNPLKKVKHIIAEGMKNRKISKKDVEFRLDHKYAEIALMRLAKHLPQDEIEKIQILESKRANAVKRLKQAKAPFSLYADTEMKILDTKYQNKINRLESEIKMIKLYYIKGFQKRQIDQIKKVYAAKFNTIDLFEPDNNKAKIDLKKVVDERNEMIKKTKEQSKLVVKDAKQKLADSQKLLKEIVWEYEKYKSETLSKIKIKYKEKNQKLNAIRRYKIRAYEVKKAVKEALQKINDPHLIESINDEFDDFTKNITRPYGSTKDIYNRVDKLLNEVGLSPSYANTFPSQMSGGQQQRVAVARSIALKPRVLIADEPIASLDVSLQGLVIQHIQKYVHDTHSSVIFISHDLEMVKKVSDYVYVLNKGRVVEKGDAKKLFTTPVHPYTKMLMSSKKTIDEALEGKPFFKYNPKKHHSNSQMQSAFHEVSENHFVFGKEDEVTKWNKGEY